MNAPPENGESAQQGARQTDSTVPTRTINFVDVQARWQAEADRLYNAYLRNADERHLRAFDVHVAAMRKGITR
jgi:hypothetical protein